MKHLRKFEELDYSTYMNAADKADKKTASDLRDHAYNMYRKDIDDMTFGILVGGVRPFPEAKFTSLDIFKSGSGWIMNTVFQSGNNTHKVTSSVSPTGEITWMEGNKFLDRKSVMDFKKMIVRLCDSHDELQSFLSENSLKPENFKLATRTFFI